MLCTQGIKLYNSEENFRGNSIVRSGLWCAIELSSKGVLTRPRWASIEVWAVYEAYRGRVAPPHCTSEGAPTLRRRLEAWESKVFSGGPGWEW